MLTQLTSLMWHVLMMSSLLLSLCLNNNKDANDDKHNNNNIQKEVRRSVSLINHVPFHFFFLCIPHHKYQLTICIWFQNPTNMPIVIHIYRYIQTYTHILVLYKNHIFQPLFKQSDSGTLLRCITQRVSQLQFTHRGKNLSAVAQIQGCLKSRILGLYDLRIQYYALSL